MTTGASLFMPIKRRAVCLDWENEREDLMMRADKWTSRTSTRAGSRLSAAALVLCLGGLTAACGDQDPSDSAVSGLSGDGDAPGSGSQPAGAGSTNGGDDIIVGGIGGTVDPAGSGGGTPVTIVQTLPPDFVAADAYGGFRVVGPVETVDLTATVECANILRVIARDLPASHSDFQQQEVNGLYEGIVEGTLGADRKPVLADPLDEDDLVLSAESFNQWYHNVEGVNLPYVVDMWLEPVGDTFVFDSASFFPLDSVGYALQEGGQGQEDGFHFTTELHTSFQYQGGETFTFRGDDDVWVFIHGKLAIDIGGVHGAEEANVNIDMIATEFGLVLGEVYTLDLFQAERRTSESNFRIETTLDFTDCGQILPVDIPVK